MKNSKIVSILLSILLILCLGCGYTFSGGTSILPPDVQKVYIPIVENDSVEGSITNLLTNSLRDMFEQYGVVTVVDTESEADAVLQVRVTDVSRGTRSVTAKTDIALQLDTTMTLDAELRRTNNAVLWKKSALEISKSFGSSASSALSSSSDFASGLIGAGDLATLDPREQQRSQEQRALEEISNNAARIIYDDAVAGDF